VGDVNPVTYPHYACKFEFPERPNKHVPSGKMPPVTVYWYEGSMVGQYKAPEGLNGPSDQQGGGKRGRRGFNPNQIFIGSKGFMGTADRGESVRLMPESKMQEFKKPPQVIRRSPGHFQDWIQACKGGEANCSPFAVAGAYVEWLLLGTICWRFPNQKLLWDPKNLRFTNNAKANEFIRPHFRKGWELKDV
jgi:hypothetical protein